MAKSIVLGNGNIFVGFDSRGQVRDLYFPFVGLENHVAGHLLHRLGVFADGRMHWLADPAWRIRIECGPDTLSGIITAEHADLGLTLIFNDIVYNEKNILIRKVRVQNHKREERTVKLFFCQEFQIYESFRGDTAYFDPKSHTIIHYKGRRVFLINLASTNGAFDDFSTGYFGSGGKEGTYKDAEDGVLSKNPIEHGPTDSVVAITLPLAPRGEQAVFYWMCIAETIKDALMLNQYVLDRSPDYLMHTAGDYWKAWVNKYNFSFYGLSDDVIALFKKSLFFIRAHADQGGSILASGDSDIIQAGKDTYGYMWPRDAAYAAMALDRAGDPNVAKRFFEFCNEVITEDGYFMHKYRPDKSLGSSWHPWLSNGAYALPIQEDETAIVLIALWKHYELSRDLEFIEQIYNSLIRKAANFLMEFRDRDTGLPKPSYDLWEEKFGVHTYTAATVYGGLIAASQFAGILGKKNSEHLFALAAREVKDGILKHLFDEKTGTFYKMIQRDDKGGYVADATVDISSVYGIYAFGVLPSDDTRVERAVAETEKRLMVRAQVPGIVRYEKDIYYTVDRKLPGNPWFITTFWFAEYYAMKAQSEKELETVKYWLSWAVQHAHSSGVLPEQLNPHTGEHVSATPLAWSHSGYVLLVLLYLDTLERLGICNVCNPVK
ncbi:MAG TPA: glycoside hydrolase family 15 protein [Candidatus Paceibacterota bacterium]